QVGCVTIALTEVAHACSLIEIRCRSDRFAHQKFHLKSDRLLERTQRRALLKRVRRLWREATLLCITHDVHDTRDFPRVLVIDAGRVVEDGAPRELAGSPASHYRALLDAEQSVAQELWSSPIWRRRRLEAGRLSASGRQQR
ncbi:MAG: hypothetical protein ACREX9_05280, partial [Gammaproteobacteria bacterium]